MNKIPVRTLRSFGLLQVLIFFLSKSSRILLHFRQLQQSTPFAQQFTTLSIYHLAIIQGVSCHQKEPKNFGPVLFGPKTVNRLASEVLGSIFTVLDVHER